MVEELKKVILSSMITALCKRYPQSSTRLLYCDLSSDTKWLLTWPSIALTETLSLSIQYFSLLLAFLSNIPPSIVLYTFNHQKTLFPRLL